jgi:hypothetical protein
MANCNICLKIKRTLKCSDCEFKSCEPCIIKWYENSDDCPCPMCKKLKTYDIDYSKVQVRENLESDDLPIAVINEIINGIHSAINFMNINLSDSLVFTPQIDRNVLTEQVRSNVLVSAIATLSMDILRDVLNDGQVFAPDEFEENYRRWPEEIRNRWTYRPMHMRIDEEEEIVGYVIRNRNAMGEIERIERLEDKEESEPEESGKEESESEPDEDEESEPEADLEWKRRYEGYEDSVDGCSSCEDGCSTCNEED